MYCMYKKGLVGSYDLKGVFFLFCFLMAMAGEGRLRFDLFVKMPLVDSF